MTAHINPDGKFQSDKYPTCPPGKVPLSVADKTAQDLLWKYAQRRRAVDAEFSEDLEACLRAEGFQPLEWPDTVTGQLHLALVEALNAITEVHHAVPSEEHRQRLSKALLRGMQALSPEPQVP